MRDSRRHQTSSLWSSLPLYCGWAQGLPLRQSSGLKSDRLVFSRQRGEVPLGCVMGLSLQISWKLYTTLKGPGNCNWDRQPPAARRLMFVVKGTFPEKRGLRAEKGWLLLDERYTWAIMQSVKSSFHNAQRCSALQDCSVSCTRTASYCKMRGNIFLKAHQKRINLS